MAAMRAGLIGFFCDKCKEAPYIKDTLGCDSPLKVAATWLGEEDEFFNCPIRFIMENTYELLDKMDSYKSGLSSPPCFEKQSAKFLLGMSVFNSYLAHFSALKRGE